MLAVALWGGPLSRFPLPARIDLGLRRLERGLLAVDRLPLGDAVAGDERADLQQQVDTGVDSALVSLHSVNDEVPGDLARQGALGVLRKHLADFPGKRPDVLGHVQLDDLRVIEQALARRSAVNGIRELRRLVHAWGHRGAGRRTT